jgi:hypothetical protein
LLGLFISRIRGLTSKILPHMRTKQQNLYIKIINAVIMIKTGNRFQVSEVKRQLLFVSTK